MNRKAFFIAIILAAAGTLLLGVYLKRFEQELSGGERIEIVLAAQPIGRGETLTEEMLTIQQVPIAYLSNRAVKAGERVKIVGLRMRNSLEPQQMVLWTDLAITTEERELSSLVQPGKRGVTVRATRSNDGRETVLVKPGDYVDVFATLVEESEDAFEESKRSVLLLQRVLVLAAGVDTKATSDNGVDDQGDSIRPRDRLLTLSLGIEEVQLLNLALERGRISVAVRNPDDQRVLENVAPIRSAALLDDKLRDQIVRRERRTDTGQPIKIEGPVR